MVVVVLFVGVPPIPEIEEDVVVVVVLSVGVLRIPGIDEDVVVLSVGEIEEDVVVVIAEGEKALPEVGMEKEVEKRVIISDSVIVFEAPTIVDKVVIVAVGIRHPSVLS